MDQPQSSHYPLAREAAAAMNTQPEDIALANLLAVTAPNSLKKSLDKAVKCIHCKWTHNTSPAESYTKGCAICMEGWALLARTSRQPTAEEIVMGSQSAAEKYHSAIEAALHSKLTMRAEHARIRAVWELNQQEQWEFDQIKEQWDSKHMRRTLPQKKHRQKMTGRRGKGPGCHRKRRWKGSWRKKRRRKTSELTNSLKS